MQDELVTEAVGDREVLKNIPVYLDLSKVMTRLSFHSEIIPRREEVPHLVEQAVSLIRPEAVYKSSPVNEKAGNYLEIDGVKFNNPLLEVNLRQVDRVFPYMVTCGKEIDALLIPGRNPGLSYVVNVVQGMILAEASNYLRHYITNRFGLDYLWSLQPGDLQAWPAADRTLLFSMLGNVKDLIGVTLTGDGTLIPGFSACGIFYSANMEFEACQVCPQEPCMGRRAPYCEELAQKYADRAGRPCGSGMPFPAMKKSVSNI